MQLGPLILLTPEKPLEDEAKVLTNLLSRYKFRLHIRHPNLSLEGHENILKEIPQEFSSRISLHDYPELAVKYHFGFHANVRYPLEKVRQFGLGPLSTSLHSTDELQSLNEVDYAFFSPVFSSLSKPGYGPSNQSEVITNFHLCRFPLFALGGVRNENISKAKELGFDGVVVLGAVWQSQEPEIELKKILVETKWQFGDRK